MPSSNSLKIIIFVLFVLVIAFTLKSMITSSPSQADSTDKIEIDIGGDDFLVAKLDKCLKLNEEPIDDGYALSDTLNKIRWYDAKNISFVDVDGNNGYMIIWKTSWKNYENLSGDMDYGNLTYDLKHSCYFIISNPKTNAVYGIILNKAGYDVNNLLHDVLGFNLPKQDETSFINNSGYNTNYNTYSGSSYHPSYDVDASPETIAKNDPDWYYDHYEYGDYPQIDDYLESQGYEGDYPDDYPSDYSEYY